MFLTKPDVSDEELREMVSQHERVKYAQNSSGYKLQNFVDERLDISVADILILLKENKIYSGRPSRTPYIPYYGNEEEPCELDRTGEEGVKEEGPETIREDAEQVQGCRQQC